MALLGSKWGSTNAYTEDCRGKPVYDWTIVDHIFDTYLEAGAKPFVEIGFMPKAFSQAEPVSSLDWARRIKYYSIGWAYPPNDYGRNGAN